MKIFNQPFFDELEAKAAASPRKRAHFTVHSAATDLVQRFFVTATRDSYFRPHRHLTKSELALVLHGQVNIVTFDDAGRVTGRYGVGAVERTAGYETPQGQWHTLIVVSDSATFLEVKEGPYDPATAAEFAPWAPAEGTPEAPAFQQRLREAQIGDSFS